MGLELGVGVWQGQGTGKPERLTFQGGNAEASRAPGKGEAELTEGSEGRGRAIGCRCSAPGRGQTKGLGIVCALGTAASTGQPGGGDLGGIG